jgi:hypothetical protein
MKLGFKVNEVNGSKPLGVNGGYVHNGNGITTYTIDLVQKHCEILCSINSNQIWVRHESGNESIFAFEFNEETHQLLAEANRYSLIVRIIPKILPTDAKWYQIEKTNTKVVTLGDGKTKSKVRSCTTVGKFVSFG